MAPMTNNKAICLRRSNSLQNPKVLLSTLHILLDGGQGVNLVQSHVQILRRAWFPYNRKHNSERFEPR